MASLTKRKINIQYHQNGSKIEWTKVIEVTFKVSSSRLSTLQLLSRFALASLYATSVKSYPSLLLTSTVNYACISYISRHYVSMLHKAYI